MRRGRQWTDEEVAFIVKERETRTFSEIGRMLGRSYTSVKNKFHGLNKKPKQSDEPGPRWDSNDVLPRIKLRKLGKDEAIPQLPGLLDHLMSMSGSMEEQTIFSKRVSLEYRETLRAAA